jgi:ribosomal protein L7/L12
MDPTAAAWIVGIAVVVVALALLVATRRRDRDPLGSSATARLPVPTGMSLTATELAELRELTVRSSKIAAIKRLREMRTLGLADAKRVIDVLYAGGTIPVTGTPSGLATPVGADSTSAQRTDTLADRTRLLRDEAGPIHAITYVREQTGMGLAEATSFVDALR